MAEYIIQAQPYKVRARYWDSTTGTLEYSDVTEKSAEAFREYQITPYIDRSRDIELYFEQDITEVSKKAFLRRRDIKIYAEDIYVSPTTSSFTVNGVQFIGYPGYNTINQYPDKSNFTVSLSASPVDTHSNAYAQMILTTHLGVNPPIMSFVYADIVPEARNLSPSAFADETKDVMLSWEFYAQTPVSGTALLQSGAKVQWRSDSESTLNEISVDGSQQYVTLMSGTLPSNSGFQWRVQVTSDDGISSEWSDWITVSTVDIIGAVSNISPSNEQVDGDTEITVSWEYENSYGSAPTGYDIEQSADGGGSWTPVKSEKTSNCFAALPPGTLTAGNILLRIRAYNTDAVAGEWTTVSIIVRSKPPIPTITAVDMTTDRPIISWESTQQQAFRLAVFNSFGTEIYSVSEIGTAKSHRLTKRLGNGSYTVRLAVSNIYALESDYASRVFELTLVQPPKPSISAEVHRGFVTLTLGHTTEKSVIIRNGTPIAAVTSADDYYADYTANGYCSYVLRALSDTAFCDSNPAAVNASVRFATIAAAEKPELYVTLICREGQNPENSVTITNETALLTLAGRANPIAEIGIHETKTKKLSYSVLNESDIDAIVSMQNKAVLWRDRKEKMYGVMSGLSYVRHLRYADLSFTITEIEFSEEVSYE